MNQYVNDTRIITNPEQSNLYCSSISYNIATGFSGIIVAVCNRFSRTSHGCYGKVERLAVLLETRTCVAQ